MATDGRLATPSAAAASSTMSNNVLRLLDKLKEKDEVIRNLRKQVSERDVTIRRLYKQLNNKEKELAAAANAAAAAVSQEKPKRKKRKRKETSSSSTTATAAASQEKSKRKKRKRKEVSSAAAAESVTAAAAESAPGAAAAAPPPPPPPLPEQEEWDEFLEKLLKFKQEHGHVIVPRNYKPDPKLVQLVDLHRIRYQALSKAKNRGTHCLTPERVETLEQIGFVWNPKKVGHDVKWDDKYQQLVEFKKKEGHTRVPPTYNISLSNWVKMQRIKYKNTIGKSSNKKGHIKLSNDRIAKLQLLEFEWEVAEKDFTLSWESQFRSLLSFKAQYGHVRVPREYKENRKLGNWVKEHRKLYKNLKEGTKSHKGLTEERIRRLEEVGFEWRVNPVPGETIAAMKNRADQNENETEKQVEEAQQSSPYRAIGDQGGSPPPSRHFPSFVQGQNAAHPYPHYPTH